MRAQAAGTDTAKPAMGAKAAGATKRSVVVGGHRTSISLEPLFWSRLRVIAEEDDISINALVTQIDRTRRGSLSSAVRMFVLRHARADAERG